MLFRPLVHGLWLALMIVAPCAATAVAQQEVVADCDRAARRLQLDRLVLRLGQRHDLDLHVAVNLAYTAFTLFVLYGFGSSETTQAFQTCLPVFASMATTLPRDVQHG